LGGLTPGGNSANWLRKASPAKMSPHQLIKGIPAGRKNVPIRREMSNAPNFRMEETEVKTGIPTKQRSAFSRIKLPAGIVNLSKRAYL